MDILPNCPLSDSEDEIMVHALLGCSSIRDVWRNSQIPFVEEFDAEVPFVEWLSPGSHGSQYSGVLFRCPNQSSSYAQRVGIDKGFRHPKGYCGGNLDETLEVEVGVNLQLLEMSLGTDFEKGVTNSRKKSTKQKQRQRKRRGAEQAENIQRLRGPVVAEPPSPPKVLVGVGFQ
ncbi:uncharacterized protein G2W53_041013 [Senna tora]|uniref:Uncharacterized protein n=1 Tax=Senna tora TaxID=362788 RepID=A0A834SJ98_9FABA|nr:uncharacterized protein G2W53_041013 [Senna tora]